MAAPWQGSDAVARVFHDEYGRCVATLARLGDIELAEEAVQDAFVVAVEKWRGTGLPPNPGGWIVTTARRRAIDRLRRESTRQARQAEAALQREHLRRRLALAERGSGSCPPASTAHDLAGRRWW